MKRIFIVLALSFIATIIYAQNKTNEIDRDIIVTGSGELPTGWHMQLDHKNADPKDLKLIERNGSFFFETGPAGIYFNPAQREKGDFTVTGKFIQQKESAHPEAYGLFFAGKNLDKDNQYYIYYLVRQDGKYLIKERNGDRTSVIINWTADKSVNAKNKKGITENLLAVKTGKDAVYFYCNGEKIANLPKQKIKSIEGQVGLRVNHNLKLEVSNYLVKKF